MIFVAVSTGHFDPLIQQCCLLSRDHEFVAQIGSSTVVPNFEYFRTGSPTKLEDYMRRAELVVTHAGTGMLSMVHGLRKPNIVIPKQARYGEANDMQVELARKWAELGMGVLCMDVRELQSAIETCRKHAFRFMIFPSLGSYLRAELGWPSPQADPSAILVKDLA